MRAFAADDMAPPLEATPYSKLERSMVTLHASSAMHLRSRVQGALEGSGFDLDVRVGFGLCVDLQVAAEARVEIDRVVGEMAVRCDRGAFLNKEARPRVRGVVLARVDPMQLHVRSDRVERAAGDTSFEVSDLGLRREHTGGAWSD